MSTPTLKTSAAKLASAREWKRRNPERAKALCDKHNAKVKNNPVLWAKKLVLSSESAKRKHVERAEYDRNRERVKLRARAIIRDRIYRGVLRRGDCEVCGKPNAEAHHSDYSKPLSVSWLCAAHHHALHRSETIAALAATEDAK